MKILKTLYVDNDVKIINHSHISGIIEISILILNHKILAVFQNLNIYDFDLIMHKLSKFNFKINVIPNGLAASPF